MKKLLISNPVDRVHESPTPLGRLVVANSLVILNGRQAPIAATAAIIHRALDVSGAAGAPRGSERSLGVQIWDLLENTAKRCSQP